MVMGFLGLEHELNLPVCGYVTYFRIFLVFSRERKSDFFPLQVVVMKGSVSKQKKVFFFAIYSLQVVSSQVMRHDK